MLRLIFAAALHGAAALALPGATPAGMPSSSADALNVMRAALHEKGRCSLAEIGDEMRAAEIALPSGMSLSEFVRSHDNELRLSGPPSNRMVSLQADSTEAAMVSLVSEVLGAAGPMTTAELRRRLASRKRSIPALSALLRSHAEIFVIESGTVRLTQALDDQLGDGEGIVDLTLLRLASLDLPSSIDDLTDLSTVRQVLLVDLDNLAFALERAVCHAADHANVLVLAFCSTDHNPRLSRRAASHLQDLAVQGRVRLIRPLRNGRNAADFVLAFWAGWLHARLPGDAHFIILSMDGDLERTVRDVLTTQGRDAVANPSVLEAVEA